ncbi:MAG: hypothetical protein J7M11_00420 [Elusimicrobia bacterium]|nr:hypothetical protein [Elusimicrobiota bacterium]
MSGEAWETIKCKGKLSKLVDTFIWEPMWPDDDTTITIKVYEDQNNEFEAIPDHALLQQGANNPYYNMEIGKSSYEVLKNVISSYQPYLKKATKIIKHPSDD